MLANKEMSTEVIADGEHLSPELLRFARQMIGVERLCLVTGAHRALGMPPGAYRFGPNEDGVWFESNGRVGYVSGSGPASSVVGLDAMVRNMVNGASVPLHDAVRMASLTPAERAVSIPRWAAWKRKRAPISCCSIANCASSASGWQALARDNFKMGYPAYPAARIIAPKLDQHFARHGRAPGAATIESLINASFWASLRREEGYDTRISLALLTPEEAEQPLRFERPLALDPATLTKVGPAVERAGIHLGVSPNGAGELLVWGTTRMLPPQCFVLEVAGPGLVVIKLHRGEEKGKFLNVAVLEGDQIKLVDEKASSLPDCPDLLVSMLGFDAPSSWVDSVNVLVQIAVSMRGHGRGGSLLIVPPGSEAWRESVIQPVPYAIAPAFCELKEIVRGPDLDPDALIHAVDAIAGLTAVDGAAVMTREYEMLGFGGKIVRRYRSAMIEEVMLTEPIEGGAPATVSPDQLGGTRHLSAAQFVHDQRDSIALVASQDGRFTVFAWSPCEKMVHAHRVESLLL